MVHVSHARRLARRWVERAAPELPGFAGAFLTGSVPGLADDAILPVCSDVDIKVVIDASILPQAPGKVADGGAILDVSFVRLEELLEPRKVLADYRLAPAFRVPTAIADPTGHLDRLHRFVAPRFAERDWVRERCGQARGAVGSRLGSVETATTLHDRVTAFHFAAGANAHTVLVAALENPTVRRRYAECARVLGEHDCLDLHERLLRTLGSEQVTASQALDHVGALGEAFDFACGVLASPYRFAADMTETARPVTIEGSLEMIEQGLHREAMFWIVAMYSRCRAVVSADAPAALAEADVGYRHLLETLGIASTNDLRARARQAELDREPVWETALSIIDRNPEGR